MESHLVAGLDSFEKRRLGGPESHRHAGHSRVRHGPPCRSLLPYLRSTWRAAALWNKLLVVLIGSALLLEYFEPVRIYVALGGAVLVALAVWLKLARPGQAQKVARQSIASSTM